MAKKKVSAAKASFHPKIHTVRIRGIGPATIECFDSYALVTTRVTAPVAPANFPTPYKSVKCRLIDSESGDSGDPEYMDQDDNDPSLYTVRIDAPSFLTVGRSYAAIVEVEWQWEMNQMNVSETVVCKPDTL